MLGDDIGRPLIGLDRERVVPTMTRGPQGLIVGLDDSGQLEVPGRISAVGLDQRATQVDAAPIERPGDR